MQPRDKMVGHSSVRRLHTSTRQTGHMPVMDNSRKIGVPNVFLQFPYNPGSNNSFGIAAASDRVYPLHSVRRHTEHPVSIECPCPFESFAIFFFFLPRDLDLRSRGRGVSSTRENRRGSR